MEKEIRFYVVLSLKQIASIKTAILLWKKIKFYPSHDPEWEMIQQDVKDNVSLLGLPKLLEDEIKCFAEPIGWRIHDWLAFAKTSMHVTIPMIEKWVWTTNGLIEKKETAALFVKNERLSVHCRYQLACLCCLENDMPGLFNRILALELENLCYFSCYPLIRFWSYFITKKFEDLNSMIYEEIGHNRHSHFQSAFMIAAQTGNVVATEHFWLKLSSKERNGFSFETAKRILGAGRGGINDMVFREDIRNTFCFLLSRMNNDELNGIFKGNPLEVLICVTDWPFHHVLVQAISRVGNYLLEKHPDSVGDRYGCLLNRIVIKGSEDCKNCIYKQLFKDLWQQTPLDIKKSVLNVHPEEFSTLFHLFQMKDVRNIKMILGEASPENRKNMLLSSYGSMICEHLVDVDDQYLFELFIKECSSSAKDVTELKEKIKRLSSKGAKILEKVNSVIIEAEGQKCKRLKLN